MDTKPLFEDPAEEEEPKDGNAAEELEKYIDSDDGATFQQFGKFGVNEDWVTRFNEETRQSHESYETKLLREDLYRIFTESYFYEKHTKTKKVPKQDMLKIFLYFYDNIRNSERYTAVEKFIEIANFMEMNFDILYKELPMVYKQNLIAELDKKYNIFDKRKVHKLF